jgi:predicted transcriptional regulator
LPLVRRSRETPVLLASVLAWAACLSALALVAVHAPRPLLAAPWLAIIPLYQRLKREDALVRRTRRELAALLQAEPGISLAEAGRRLALSPRSVAYHVRLLERLGVVVLRRSQGKLRIYLNGSAKQVPPEECLAASHRVASRILEELSLRGLSRADLHARLPSIPRTTIHWHVRRLLALGIVREETEPGRGAARLSLADEADKDARETL